MSYQKEGDSWLWIVILSSVVAWLWFDVSVGPIPSSSQFFSKIKAEFIGKKGSDSSNLKSLSYPDADSTATFTATCNAVAASRCSSKDPRRSRDSLVSQDSSSDVSGGGYHLRI
jgi:hypothetical protein